MVRSIACLQCGFGQRLIGVGRGNDEIAEEDDEAVREEDDDDDGDDDDDDEDSSPSSYRSCCVYGMHEYSGP